MGEQQVTRYLFTTYTKLIYISRKLKKTIFNRFMLQALSIPPENIMKPLVF